MDEIQPFNKTTLQKMAACSAVGLSYWSDHPATGCMWAVDEHQQAHVVKWYRKTNEVSLPTLGEPRKVIDWAKGRAAYKWEYPIHDYGIDRVKVA